MASSSSNLKLQLKKTSNKEINEILTKNPIKAFVLSFPEQRLYFKVRKESFVNFELNKEKDTLMMKKVNKKRKGYYGDQLINLKADPIDLKVESYVDKFFEDKKISFEMKEGGNEIIMKNNRFCFSNNSNSVILNYKSRDFRD